MDKHGGEGDLIVEGEDDMDSYEGTLKMTKFIMKNGCCRDCMKAFSKTGKVNPVLY